MDGPERHHNHPDLLARDNTGKLWFYPGNGKGWFAPYQIHDQNWYDLNGGF